MKHESRRTAVTRALWISNCSSGKCDVAHFLSVSIFHLFPSSQFNFDLFLTMSSQARYECDWYEHFASLFTMPSEWHRITTLNDTIRYGDAMQQHLLCFLHMFPVFDFFDVCCCCRWCWVEFHLRFLQTESLTQAKPHVDLSSTYVPVYLFICLFSWNRLRIQLRIQISSQKEPNNSLSRNNKMMMMMKKKMGKKWVEKNAQPNGMERESNKWLWMFNWMRSLVQIEYFRTHNFHLSPAGMQHIRICIRIRIRQVSDQFMAMTRCHAKMYSRNVVVRESGVWRRIQFIIMLKLR